MSNAWPVTSGGGGGGGSVPAIGPAHYSRPSDPVLAEAYDLGLLRWIQPEADYTSFVGNPSEGLTRLECAELITAFCGLSPQYGNPDFSDTNALTYEQKAVIWTVLQKGLMSGYSDGTFRPNQYVSRAQGCQLLYWALNMSLDLDSIPINWLSESELSYSDIEDIPDVFMNSVSAFHQLGIITAYPDGTFRPNSIGTRNDIASWFIHAAKIQETVPYYFVPFAPRIASTFERITTNNVEQAASMQVLVMSKDGLPRNLVMAAAFFGEGFKGMGLLPVTLATPSEIVSIPIGGQPLSGSTTVKLYALDANTLRPLSPPAVFDLMP